jgi:8-oxo-dGTP pyrophosphatase MutT (NUDIX family)
MAEERFEGKLSRWARGDDGGEARPAVPAATVILLRDAAAGVEALMVKRDSKLAFAGGMWVFPGGRVDPDDYPPDAPDDVARASCRAAVREAHEEAGLVVDEASLVRLSHWTPPPQTPKRFSTWFYLAPAPDDGRCAVTIDDGEIRDHMWVSPVDALRRRDALEIELAPPTWVTLHTLAATASVRDALAAAGGAEPEHFTTRAAVTEDGVVVMWHGDAGYDSGDAAIEGPRHRLWMVDGPWRYERWT